MKTKNVFLEVICCLLIILFFYTGLSKLADYKTFEFDWLNTPFLNQLAPYIGIIVPIIELIVALCLVIPKTRKIGLQASMVLMVVFTLYVALILSLAKHKPCTCGGVLRELNWREHLWFNIAFTVLTFVGLKLFKSSGRGSTNAATLDSSKPTIGGSVG